MKQLFKEYEDKYKEVVKQDKYRLQYHLMPPVGWLNDPNGLCQFKGIYHIFYQYSPTSALGKEKGWGHYTTKDFINYNQEENTLYPDSEIDKSGAYSGSAFVEDDIVHFFYTGNIKFKGNYDYINEGRGHYVNYFTTKDGIHFSSKECLLKNSDYPSNMSCHIRDPKIYKENNNYYLVLGARTKDSVGELLIYKSNNLKDWKYSRIIRTDYKFGYMWECPDLFKINNQKILITCPQGVEQEGYKYENVYQNGYFLVDGDIEEEIKLSEFNELDKGFDFYAPQTFEDEQGRRILIGWMGLPDITYTNPTVEYHWQHSLTLPRELTLVGNKIYQYPIKEIENLRKNKKHIHLNNEQYNYQTNVIEMHIKPNNKEFSINLRKDVKLEYHDHLFILSLKQSGYGRDKRHLEIENIDSIDIFSDTSSLEIFINKGEAVMTTRVYDEKDDTYIETNDDIDIDFYELNSYIINDNRQ